MAYATEKLGGLCWPGVATAQRAVLCCALLLGPWATPQAFAHSWYPKKCCNDQDCFRATAVKRLDDGSLLIDAGHISVIVPKGFPARPSQDNDPHVCVYRDIRGHYHPRCVFLPGIG